MQRSQQSAEPSMDEILASIRKIIADDPKPPADAPPAGAANGARVVARPADPLARVEPRDGPLGTSPAGDRRIAAEIDRDLADLLDDGAQAAEKPVDSASTSTPVRAGDPPPAVAAPRLAKPGWLTARPASPPASDAAGAPAGEKPRPIPLSAKLEQARLAAPAALPLRGSAASVAAPVPRPAAPADESERGEAGKPAAPAPVETAAGEVQAKPAAPVSPALSALAQLADGTAAAPAASKPIKSPAAEPVEPSPSTDAAAPPAVIADAASAAPTIEPAKIVAAAPVLSTEAIVAALPSSRPLGPGAEATVRSVEDLVAELLRPMLRQWLDENMPRIVEKALRIELASGLKLPTLPAAVAVADKPVDKA